MIPFNNCSLKHVKMQCMSKSITSKFTSIYLLHSKTRIAKLFKNDSFKQKVHWTYDSISTSNVIIADTCTKMIEVILKSTCKNTPVKISFEIE